MSVMTLSGDGDTCSFKDCRSCYCLRPPSSGAYCDNKVVHHTQTNSVILQDQSAIFPESVSGKG